MNTEETKLTALIDRAATRLAEAKTSAEVLEARAAAQAALHYAKIKKAANETQADCLKMSVRAEMRMANEIDRAQEAGEILKKGDARSQGNAINLKEAGIDSRRIAEWREVRDAGEDVVNETIQNALEEGRAPTKTEILKAAKGNMRTIGTGENEWYTPMKYVELAREVLGEIDLDPASNDKANDVVKAKVYYTKEDDGLEKKWSGRIFMNPPYSWGLMPKFIDKLLSSDFESAIILTHNNTDTKWFHKLAKKSSALCFTEGRISFYREDIGASPTNGQIFFYIGNNIEGFANVFGEIGFVVCPYQTQ